MPDSFGVGRFFICRICREDSVPGGIDVNPDQWHRSIACMAHTGRLQSGADSMDFIRIIIAILLPPLGVFLQVGFGGAFWLNILLTLCGYIPGIVHAVYIIAKR
jgi:uncharacterized membrane protein YqaE (UPF0057 family)